MDWASLTKDIQPIVVQDASDAGGDGETKVSILERFKPANVLTRVGVSRALAGSALMKEIEAMCQRPGGENKSGMGLIIIIIIINTHFIAPNTRRLLGASQINIHVEGTPKQ